MRTMLVGIIHSARAGSAAVANHVSNILTKLRLRDRAEAIAVARKAGLDNRKAL